MLVAEENRDALCLLWFKEHDSNGSIDEYECDRTSSRLVVQCTLFERWQLTTSNADNDAAEAISCNI